MNKKTGFVTLGEICDVKVVTKKLSQKQKEFLKIILDYKRKHNCL